MGAAALRSVQGQGRTVTGKGGSAVGTGGGGGGGSGLSSTFREDVEFDPPPKSIETLAAEQDEEAEEWIKKAWAVWEKYPEGSAGRKQWEYLIQRYKVGWGRADDQLRKRDEPSSWTLERQAELTQMGSDWPADVPRVTKVADVVPLEERMPVTDPATLRATSEGELVEGAPLSAQLGEPTAGSGGVLPYDEDSPIGKALADAERARVAYVVARKKTLVDSPAIEDVNAAVKAKNDYKAATAVVTSLRPGFTPSGSVFGRRDPGPRTTPLYEMFGPPDRPFSDMFSSGWGELSPVEKDNQRRIARRAAAEKLVRTRTRQAEAGTSDVTPEWWPDWVHRELIDIPGFTLPDYGEGLKSEMDFLSYTGGQPAYGTGGQPTYAGGVHFTPTRPLSVRARERDVEGRVVPGGGKVGPELTTAQLIDKNAQAIRTRTDARDAINARSLLLGHDDPNVERVLEQLSSEITYLERIRDEGLAHKPGVQHSPPESGPPDLPSIDAPVVKPRSGGRF